MSELALGKLTQLGGRQLRQVNHVGYNVKKKKKKAVQIKFYNQWKNNQLIESKGLTGNDLQG